MTLVPNTRPGPMSTPDAAPCENKGYAWAIRQADMLPTGRVEVLDLDRFADEIADAARHQALRAAVPEASAQPVAAAWDRGPSETGLPETAMPHRPPCEWNEIMDRELPWIDP